MPSILSTIVLLLISSTAVLASPAPVTPETVDIMYLPAPPSLAPKTDSVKRTETEVCYDFCSVIFHSKICHTACVKVAYCKAPRDAGLCASLAVLACGNTGGSQSCQADGADGCRKLF
jgi:hypothetical protein